MFMIDRCTIDFCNMGLFTTDDKWIHPKKCEQTYEIIYVVNGTIYVEEDEIKHSLKKGDLLVLKPHHTHFGYEYSYGNTSFYWMHFFAKSDASTVFFPYSATDFPAPHLFKELLHYSYMPSSPQCITDALLAHLLAELALTAHKRSPASKLAIEIYEWVRINIDASMTVGSVSAHFNYNPEYLSRLVRKNYCTGLKALIDMLLIRRIKDLLCNTNYSVKEIAHILNFDNLSACINFFKYHEKTSPSKYRNMYFNTHMNKK